MTDGLFKVGDVVWTKMRGYCPWPSRIASPTESNLKNTEADKSKSPRPYYLVYFFGSNNFAWMPEDTIKPFKEYEEENKKKGKKNQQFKKGIEAIELYMQKVENGTLTPPPEQGKEDTDDHGPPSPSGDSLSNDTGNLDGPLPSIDEEIAIVRGKKPVPNSATTKKQKNSHDSHDDPSSLSPSAPASVQRDYSRTPFNQSKRKSAKSDIDSTTDITTTSPTKRLKADDDDFDAPNLSSPTISTPRTQPPSKIQARNIITKVQQPDYPPVIDTPQVDSSFRTNRYKDIRASNLKFGFLGLGMMGQILVKHLLGSRHSVTVWNRNRSVLEAYEKVGATVATTASDVVGACDITFACLSGPAASKEVVFSQFGVLSEMGPGKSYVELSSIDPDTCSDISEAIVARQGNFLSAPIITGGKTAAANGELIIVASGDRHVYEECAASCFKAMGSRSFYLGPDYCNAVRMNLIASSFFGTVVGSIIECLRMLERVDLKKQDFLEIIKLSSMNSPLVEQILQKVLKRKQDVEVPINYLQKDLRMMLNMSEEKDTGCPITATVNEVYKSKKRIHDGQDVSSLYYAGL